MSSYMTYPELPGVTFPYVESTRYNEFRSIRSKYAYYNEFK